jgi:hypothetical protein
MFSDTDQPTYFRVTDSSVYAILLTSLVTCLVTQISSRVCVLLQFSVCYFTDISCDMFSDTDQPMCLRLTDSSVNVFTDITRDMFSDTDQPTYFRVTDTSVSAILLTSLVTCLVTRISSRVCVLLQFSVCHFIGTCRDMVSDMDHTKCLVTVLTVQLM